MEDLISRQELIEAMYHEAMEEDSEEQRWDGGCWIRYKMFERVLRSLPSAQKWIPVPEGGIGELSDGYHTFNGLYKQRMILFAALVKAYKDKAWKSYRHEDGEYCFGGGWFIVGLDTPKGSYTYHYENKYWDMFDCVDLPMGKHWDGHTEDDAETRLMSLGQNAQRWIPVSERLPEKPYGCLVTVWDTDPVSMDEFENLLPYFVGWDGEQWNDADGCQCPFEVIAWMPLPPAFKEEE